MEHKYKSNITCPYCNWEDKNSWEFEEESGTKICGRCEEEFNVVREVEVTYNTSKINCEEEEKEHNYLLKETFLKKRKYENGSWINLSENEWEYCEVMVCSNCDNIEYIDITKEQYEQHNIAYLKND